MVHQIIASSLWHVLSIDTLPEEKTDIKLGCALVRNSNYLYNQLFLKRYFWSEFDFRHSIICCRSRVSIMVIT